MEKAEYEAKFTKLVKSGMEGLLEPYGEMLKQYGYYQTKHNIERLCLAFRELLETIV